MIKVADINISEDNCGLYVIRLRGLDAQYFQVIDKKLYFLLTEPNICKQFYTVTISIEDLAGRFIPKTSIYTLNTINCSCNSTTSSTTTTITTTNNPTQCLVRYSRGIINLINFGSYYTGTVTGSLTEGPVWGTNQYGYTDDSHFGVAAVHAGLVIPGQTSTIKFTILGNKTNFPSSTANGVTTSPWPSSWCAVQLSQI